MKKKNKMNLSSPLAQIKVARKASREEEIAMHGKPIGYSRVEVSRKIYKRKRFKADADEAQPYFILFR